MLQSPRVRRDTQAPMLCTCLCVRSSLGSQAFVHSGDQGAEAGAQLSTHLRVMLQHPGKTRAVDGHPVCENL
jgi:hypothetical protein